MPDTCVWCGRAFTPRCDGGKPQRFCSIRCRRALDAAGRRYIADALASGALTIADLRRGAPRAVPHGTRRADPATAPAADPFFAQLLDEIASEAEL
jgi:hypothetical protein